MQLGSGQSMVYWDLFFLSFGFVKYWVVSMNINC